LEISHLLRAFELSATVVGGAIGAVMAPSIKNDNGNLAALCKASTKFSTARVRELLAAELATGVHKLGGSSTTLRDPSAALSVVWLRRSLALQTAIIDGLVADWQAGKQLTMSAIVTQAYTDELERYHNWMLRGTMKVAFNAAPSKEVVVRNLAGSTPLSNEGDRCNLLFGDLSKVVEAQQAVLKAMAKPLVELDLDRTARCDPISRR